MAPYYDVFINGNFYKLYLKDKEYDTFLKEPKKGIEPYGRLSYTFNPSTQIFEITLEELSDRAQYLIENEWLCIAACVEQKGRAYPNPYKLKEGNTKFYRISSKQWRNGKKPRGRWVYEEYRNPKMYCPSSGETKKGINIKLVTNATDKISFPFEDIKIPRHANRMWEEYDDAFLDIKFNFYTKRGDGRFLKTISDTFHLTKH